MHGDFRKWSFLKEESEKTGGDEEEEGVDGGAWQDVFTAVMVMN